MQGTGVRARATEPAGCAPVLCRSIRPAAQGLRVGVAIIRGRFRLGSSDRGRLAGSGTGERVGRLWLLWFQQAGADT